MSDIERNESGNDSIIEQEKQDSAHDDIPEAGITSEALEDELDTADEAVDDLANDNTETSNDVKNSGGTGI